MVTDCSQQWFDMTVLNVDVTNIGLQNFDIVCTGRLVWPIPNGTFPFFPSPPQLDRSLPKGLGSEGAGGFEGGGEDPGQGWWNTGGKKCTIRVKRWVINASQINVLLYRKKKMSWLRRQCSMPCWGLRRGRISGRCGTVKTSSVGYVSACCRSNQGWKLGCWEATHHAN